MGNQERDAAIIERILSGKESLAEIGKDYGLSRQAVSVLARRRGVEVPKKPPKPKRDPIPREERITRLQAAAMRANQKKRKRLKPRNDLIEKLARAGWKYDAIAAEITEKYGKIHPVTISVILRARGYYRGKWGKGRKPDTSEAA